MIKPCSCKNKFQDKKYGEGNRVHNKLSEKSYDKWCCTVCNKRK
jgi:hypothetical protein